MLILCIMLISSFFCGTGASYAQTPSSTALMTPVIPFGAPGSAPAVCGAINGLVLDINGIPVSGANVTLWKNGLLAVDTSNWITTSEIYNPNDASNEGSFTFYGVYPGNYTVRAEKDGYVGETLANVSNDTIHHTIAEINASSDTVNADIILQGYRAPVFDTARNVYGGGISGVAFDQVGTIIPVAEITLMQNGQIVRMPKNPQHTQYNGTYIFDHIAPGQYQLTAEIEGHKSSPITVEVNNSTVVANMTVQDYAYAPPGIPAPTSSAMSTQYPSPSQAVPTPFPGLSAILLTIAISSFFTMKKKK